MTSRFRIRFPIYESSSFVGSPIKKLWYDTKSKQMIEVSGDREFKYNYSSGRLSVSGNGRTCSVIKNRQKDIFKCLQRQFDFDIINKSKFNSNVEITIELLDDLDEFCSSLDDYGLTYFYE